MSQSIGFQLEINFPDQSPHTIPIGNKLSLGGSEKSELCIEDYGLSPIHLSFRIHNSVLSLHNLGGQNPTTLGEQILSHGKMYLLNVGDVIKVGDIEITIQEKSISEEAATEEEKVEAEEESSQGVQFQEMTDEQIQYEDDLGEQDTIDDKTFNIANYKETLKEELEDSTSDISEKKSVVKVNDKKCAPEDTIEKKKKSSFLSRTFGKKKKSSIPQVKAKPRPRKNSPGPFIRLFSLMINVSITLTIIYEVLSISQVSEIFSPVYNLLTPLLKQVPKSELLTLNIFSVLATYFLIEITTSIILSVNLGQFLLGIKTTNGFAISRFQAILRSIISAITTPLLIFDVPCIIGKRTFKEFVTGTRLTTRSKLYTIPMCLIMTPLCLLLPFIVPAFNNIDLFNEIETSNSIKISLSKEERIKPVWPSDILKGKFFGYWSKDFSITPNLKVDDTEDSISIYNKTNEFVESVIELTKEEDFLSYIKSYKDLNPLLFYECPDLSELADQKEIKVLTPLHLEQFSDLISMSLALDTENLTETFITHGPIFKALYQIKKDMIRLLEIEESTHIEMYKTQKKLLIYATKYESLNHPINVFYLDNLGKIKIYKSTSSSEFKKIHSEMTKLFFQNIKRKKKGDVSNSWDWTKLSNLLTEVKRSKRDITDLEIAAIYDHYFDTASLIISLETKELKRSSRRNWYAKKIEQTSEYLEDLLEFKNHPHISELRDSLNKLKQALDRNDLSFFSL